MLARDSSSLSGVFCLWLASLGSRRAFRIWMRQQKIPESRRDCLSIGCTQKTYKVTKNGENWCHIVKLHHVCVYEGIFHIIDIKSSQNNKQKKCLPQLYGWNLLWAYTHTHAHTRVCMYVSQYRKCEIKRNYKYFFTLMKLTDIYPRYKSFHCI